MQGQSETLTSAEVIENAYEYKFLEDRIMPLKNPVGEDIDYDHNAGYNFTPETNQADWLRDNVTGSSCYGNTNLVPEFCRAYTALAEKKVLAVHIAKGSTEIADWLPGSQGYDIILKKASAAVKKVRESGESGNRIFFVWLQGESDAIFGKSKAYYKQKINDLYAVLKTDIGIEKFGIIRVGRFTNDERDLEIISAQDEVCQENEDFLMLTQDAVWLNEQSEYMNPYVGGHYSARGLEKLGSKAGTYLGAYAGRVKL